MPSKATWQKVQILKIQDGGRLPFWKSLNRHISVKNRPILMKFGRLHCSKYWTRRLSHEKLKKKFKMASSAILNIAFMATTYIEILDYPTLFTLLFVVIHVSGSPERQPTTPTSPAVVVQWRPSIVAASVGRERDDVVEDRRRRCRAVNLVDTVSSHRWTPTRRPISAKFCTRKQKGMPTKAM